MAIHAMGKMYVEWKARKIENVWGVHNDDVLVWKSTQVIDLRVRSHWVKANAKIFFDVKIFFFDLFWLFFYLFAFAFTFASRDRLLKVRLYWGESEKRHRFQIGSMFKRVTCKKRYV